MTTDTPIREVIARTLCIAEQTRFARDAGNSEWDIASVAETFSTGDMSDPDYDDYWESADAVRDALAALTDADVDAAIERYNKAWRAYAYSYVPTCTDAYGHDDNSFIDAIEDALLDLRAIIAMRGRGVVMTEEMARIALIRFQNNGDPAFKEDIPDMVAALEAALAAKEQG